MKITQIINRITQILNMTKSHILRVILCSIATMSILITVGVVNRVFYYIFARWQLDIIQNNISSSVPVEYIFTVFIWNYVIGIVIILLIWKYIGMPKITMIGKYYKRFIDMYSVN
ncbi:unnamed protein product [marine sediment metagenome]|uniref:Uncharacterized protein n=1 Tax=marine sediment metagenome TaxID=412755 RepID=X1C8H2_9ZZZZ